MSVVTKEENKGERLEGFALSNSLSLSLVLATDPSFPGRLECLTSPCEPVMWVVALMVGDFGLDQT